MEINRNFTVDLSTGHAILNSPYVGLNKKSYWRSGVADADPLLPDEIYLKKFDISIDEKIATAGSCFAQHIATRLRQNGYNVMAPIDGSGATIRS
jgi:hypothetical protein